MSHSDTAVHLIAGGLGGTAGAVVTCPLEVVKTRLQSTVATFHHNTRVSTVIPHQSFAEFGTYSSCRPSELLVLTRAECAQTKAPKLGIWNCLKYIIETEGTGALFKGLGPNLIGVAPSRAIYFCTYSRAKKFFNQFLTPDTPKVHMFSAICGGFASSTVTNPIWVVKTRLQLDQRKNGSLTIRECVLKLYKSKGFFGFYKGLSASYVGISETVIHFVLYEAMKAKLRQCRNGVCCDEKTSRDFFEYMFAAAFSKTCAACIAYPHEVARTRLRQEGEKYRGFCQTLATVLREEGHHGLYRGLTTHLLRQIPNTAIMMSTYELIVYLFSNYDLKQPDRNVLTKKSTFVNTDDDIK